VSGKQLELITYGNTRHPNDRAFQTEQRYTVPFSGRHLDIDEEVLEALERTTAEGSDEVTGASIAHREGRLGVDIGAQSDPSRGPSKHPISYGLAIDAEDPSQGR
jgi:hypothetical protein